MRRWLVVVLLMFLPLQYSWAVVADYCRHETGAAASHLGHHDHVGHGHAADPAPGADKAPADVPSSDAPDGDCCHCHGCCTGLVGMAVSSDPATLRSAPCSAGECSVAMPLADQPERPQWAALA